MAILRHAGTSLQARLRESRYDDETENCKCTKQVNYFHKSALMNDHHNCEIPYVRQSSNYKEFSAHPNRQIHLQGSSCRLSCGHKMCLEKMI